MSSRRLSVLLRYLPADSALVTALNDGRPMWTTTDHLLADLWELTVRAHSGDTRPVEHPVRAEFTARAKVAAKKALKVLFLQRKNRYQRGGEWT